MNVKNVSSNFAELYHGTSSGNTDRIDISLNSRKKTDFGAGFYLTDDKDFASIIASSSLKDENAYVYRFGIDKRHLSSLNIYRFPGVDLNWLLFVSYNRKRWTPEMAPGYCDSMREFFSEKDIIIGPTANDRYYSLLKDFMSPEEAGEQVIPLGHNIMLKCMQENIPANQFVLKSQKACDIFTDFAYVKKNLLSPEERAAFFRISNERAAGMKGYVHNILLNFVRTNPVSHAGLPFREFLERIDYEKITWEDIQNEAVDLSGWYREDLFNDNDKRSEDNDDRKL